jgi:nucleotide-binding universal stress UspA family protein
VILVHVVDDQDLGSLGASREKVLEDSRAKLDEQATSRAASSASIRTELVIGPPDETTVGMAETEHCDLIVIAARSTSSSLLRLGSTTSKIIAQASMPVVVVRDPAPWLLFAQGERPLRMLLGIDDSAVCDLGIQWVQALRAIGPVEVVLGAIYYPDDATSYYGLDQHGMVDSDPEVERLMSRDLLRRFGSDANAPAPYRSPTDAPKVPPGSIVARPRRGLGRIGDHMVELARDEKVDAIVVGTGQKTGLGRLGSVSSVIVNRAVPYAFAVTDPDAEVHILHVVKEDDEIDEGDVTRQLTALAPTNAKQKVHTHVVRGDDAATTVAQTAARLGVDVICIASHGRTGITRALVGSVADRLLRATRLPVLVLRPA